MIGHETPVDLDREEARERALEELSDPIYREDQEGLVERAITNVLDWFNSLVESASGAPGGPWATVLLILVLVGVVLVIRARLGPLSRGRRRSAPVMERAGVGSTDLRAAADAAAAEGDFTRATQERFRALVRGMEESSVLRPAPGRTADEAAEELAVSFASSRRDLRRAARTFDDLTYGQRGGSEAEFSLMCDLDRELLGVQHGSRR